MATFQIILFVFCNPRYENQFVYFTKITTLLPFPLTTLMPYLGLTQRNILPNVL